MEHRAKLHLILRGLQVVIGIITIGVSAKHVRGDTAFPFFCGVTGLLLSAVMTAVTLNSAGSRVLHSFFDMTLSGIWAILNLAAGAYTASVANTSSDNAMVNAAAAFCYLAVPLFVGSTIMSGQNWSEKKEWQPFVDDYNSQIGQQQVLPVSLSVPSVKLSPGTGVIYTPSTLPQQPQPAVALQAMRYQHQQPQSTHTSTEQVNTARWWR